MDECEIRRHASQIEAMDLEIVALDSTIVGLQLRLKHGDKQAYKSFKILKMRLARLRQMRCDLSRRDRRLERAA